MNRVDVADYGYAADHGAMLRQIVVQEPSQLPCWSDRVHCPHRLGGLTREAAGAYEQEGTIRKCHRLRYADGAAE
jgi:hypothetical protein